MKDCTLLMKEIAKATEIEPRFFPMMVLVDGDNVHGDSLIGYHRDELAEGKSTVFGIHGVAPGYFTDRYDENKRGSFTYSGFTDDRFPYDRYPQYYGSSLLDVLYEHTTDEVRRLKLILKSPANWGAGSIDESAIEEAEDLVTIVERFRATLKMQQKSLNPKI